MNQKNNIKYVLMFITPDFSNYMFLAYNADIKSICYSKHPRLPGTALINYAKTYNSVEDAKNDLYLLRYHHRCFLAISNAIIPVESDDLSKEYNDPIFIIDYEPTMFIDSSKNTLE